MTQKRHTQSKAKIKAAITELLLENNDFSSITIRQITEKANINRSTFYLHYQDKYDLIDKLMHEITDNLRKELNTNSATVKEGLIHSLTYLQSQQEFIKLIIGIAPVNFSQKTRHFISKLIETTPALFYDILNPDLPLPKDYMLTTYAASIESIYTHWVSTDNQASPEKVANMILTVRRFYQKNDD